MIRSLQLKAYLMAIANHSHWWSRNRFAVLWMSSLIVVALVHYATITTSPTIWFDEVSIIDLGRTALPGADKTWGINWSPQNNRPALTFGYPAMVAQELAFRLVGSPVGPRLMTLLGAVVAAVLAACWLNARGVPKFASWAYAMIFLLDHHFGKSFRGARIDCWAFASVFAACFMLRSSLPGVATHKSLRFRMILTGFFAASSVFVWPSAVLLFPLIAVEFALSASGDGSAILEGLKKHSRALPWIFLGGLCGALVWTVPMIDDLGVALTDLFSRSARDLNSSGHSLQTFLRNMKEVIVTFISTPFVIVLALVGILFRRNLLISSVTLVVLAFMLNTRVYDHRLIYLWPYFLALMGGSYVSLSSSKHNKGLFPLYKVCMGLALIWVVVLSLVFRPALTLAGRQARDPQVLADFAVQTIGFRPVSVMAPMEYYYIGRTLGWRMFGASPCTEYPQGNSEPVITCLDYLILQEGSDLQKMMAPSAQKAGLEIIARSDNRECSPQEFKLFGIPVGAQGYGSYLVYGRHPTKPLVIDTTPSSRTHMDVGASADFSN